jgi:disulfide bond formation protein DsbB
MVVTTRGLAGAVLAASALVLGTALLSQYWGGLSPCELCLLQRWPWRAAIALSLIALALGPRCPAVALAVVLALVFLASAGLAVYHVGVEQHWFIGPTACTAAKTGAKTVEELGQQLLGQQAVLCDQVQWSLFGISLAGWNLVASAALAVGCAIAATRARTAA